MKVVVAIDSFKGSMTSLEAGVSVKRGVEKAENAVTADVMVSPIADGGEGTVEALVTGMGGSLKKTVVSGPLGQPVEAEWGIIDNNGEKTAVIEMAAAAGIVLLKKDELNPLETTSYGVGELIREAVKDGCRRFIVGIGGSATNDGGVGMLQALGFDFMDKAGNQIARGAKGLKNLAVISAKNCLPELKEISFRVACDVKNPLCGPNGCSAVYGPQKGADEEMIKDMDGWLSNYAAITQEAIADINAAINRPAANASAEEMQADMNYPGCGAAGGMGFAFRSFLNAKLEPGIEIILEETGLEEQVKTADIVVTGEGRMDSQTVMGKVPVGVAKIAKKYGKKVIAFCGCATEDAGLCNDYGIDAYFPILRGIVSAEEAMDRVNAMNNLEKTSEQVFRLLKKNI